LVYTPHVRNPEKYPGGGSRKGALEKTPYPANVFSVSVSVPPGLSYFPRILW